MKFFFLFLALGISFFWNNSLTPIVLSETVGEPKKEQFLDSNAKVIEQFKLKADKSEESSDWINAIKYRRKILTLTKQKYGLKHGETASAYNALGFLHNALGEYEKAEVFKNLRNFYKSFRVENIETVKYLNNLGSIYETLGKYEKAEPLLRQSLEIRKSVFGLEHPDTSQALNNLAGLFEVIGEYEKAEPLYRESLEITKSVFGTSHFETTYALNNLGLLYLSLGEYEKAEPLYKESLEIRKRVLGLEHPDTANSFNNLDCYINRLVNMKKLNLFIVNL